MVVALGVVQRRLSLPALKQIVRTRFLTYRRFQCRPVDDYLGASWQHDDGFDLDAHVHRVALANPTSQSELEELAGELASAPLPSDRPMWSFHLVERYRGGSAFIIRIHHSYADGIALVNVMFGLTDEGAAAEPDASLPTPADKEASGESDSLFETMGAAYISCCTRRKWGLQLRAPWTSCANWRTSLRYPMIQRRNSNAC
jgi:Wax ester synthase-like Acyl-CoA acyltransferase domain